MIKISLRLPTYQLLACLTPDIVNGLWSKTRKGHFLQFSAIEDHRSSRFGGRYQKEFGEQVLHHDKNTFL
jgi:hypothetical protein